MGSPKEIFFLAELIHGCLPRVLISGTEEDMRECRDTPEQFEALLRLRQVRTDREIILGKHTKGDKYHPSSVCKPRDY